MSLANRILIAIALVSTLPAFGADEWIRISTPHLELYTLSGDKGAAEKKGRDAIVILEQVRGYVLDAARANWDQAIPVRIISFQSDKQFKPYAPGNGTAVYSSDSQSRDYIVMVDSDPDHLPNAIHQYVHLALQRAGFKLPMWLNEGLAEMFTTLKPAGADAMIGAALKDHADDLKSAKWLDFNALTSADEKSPSYNEGNRTGLFYAESWALVHMLYLGRDYRENFGKMVTALNDGKSTADAWQSAYGRTVAQIYSDLQAYVRQNSLIASAVKSQKAVDNPITSTASDVESGVMLADLLAATNRRDQAKAAYDKLAKQYPGDSSISESLGYMAWQSGDSDSARKYFEEALPGTKDPQMCYHLAMLYHDAGQGGDKLIATLQRAVALKPDYAEARLQLGIAEYNRENYPAAIAALAPIERIEPQHAAALYGALAYSYSRTGDLVNARKALDIDRRFVKTAADKERADQLAEYLDAHKTPDVPPQPEPGPARPSLHRADGSSEPSEYAAAPAATVQNLPGGLRRVEGEAQSLDCDGDHPRLSVLVGTATMTFEIADPKQVTLRHAGSGHFEFVCGPMKFHVTVEYLPNGNVLKAIEF